jgi:hypothetical protein
MGVKEAAGDVGVGFGIAVEEEGVVGGGPKDSSKDGEERGQEDEELLA